MRHLNCSLYKKIRIAPAIIYRRIMNFAYRALSREKAVMTLEGVRIPFNNMFLKIEERIMIAKGRYMEFASLALQNNLSPNDQVINIDCNFCYLSVIASKKLASQQQVFSYESDHRYAKSVRSILEANSLALSFKIKTLGAETITQETIAYNDFWSEDSFQSYSKNADDTKKIQIHSFEDEFELLDKKPNYLICNLNNINMTIFSSKCVDRLEKILIIANSVDLRMEQINSTISILLTRKWRIETWPGRVFYFYRESASEAKYYAS